MKKSHFKKEIQRQFNQLESSAAYYWTYLRELRSFKFICELAYDSSLIDEKTYLKSMDFCSKELSRYER